MTVDNLGISPTLLVYGMMLLLITIPIGLIACIARWDSISWFLWKRRWFRAWEKQQEARIAFLMQCGASRAAAISTVLRESMQTHTELFKQPEKWRWDSPHARALSTWMESAAIELRMVAENRDLSLADRTAAIEAALAFHERDANNKASALRFLKHI